MVGRARPVRIEPDAIAPLIATPTCRFRDHVTSGGVV